MCTLRPLNGTYWHNDCEIEEIVTKGSFSFPGYILGAEITVCNYLGSFLLESGNWKTLPPMGFSDPISLGKKLLPCYLRFSQPCFRDTELHLASTRITSVLIWLLVWNVQTYADVPNLQLPYLKLSVVSNKIKIYTCYKKIWGY